MSKAKKHLQVCVGDIVQIGPDKYVPHLGRFRAEVMRVSENSIGDTIVTYKKTRGKTPDFPNVNVSLIKKVIKAAPYVCGPRAQVNIFADMGLFWVRRTGTIYTGTLADLVMCALSKVRHIDLLYPIHIGRVEALYEKGLWPGMTPITVPFGIFSADDNISVNWKAFERWVHANAGRLIKTKTEVREVKLAHKKLMDDHLKDTILGDMDVMMEEDTSLEARHSPQALDNEPIDAGYP